MKYIGLTDYNQNLKKVNFFKNWNDGEKNNNHDILQIDICNVRGLNRLSYDIKKYGYPTIDIFNDKEIFNSIFKLDNIDNSVLYKFLNKYVLKDRKKELLKDDTFYNLLDYYLTAYGNNITNYDEVFDIYCKLFPKTRDQLMKLLLEKEVDRLKAYRIAMKISTGKNENYAVWKRNINKTYDILEVETGMYLELTNYLPPLGHVIAYVRYDALINYYELKRSEKNRG